MARYQMEDGTVLDTERSTQSWDEESDWNGSNWVSRATGSQWNHETLYRSRRGRYYIEHISQMQGVRARAAWIEKRDAAAWLLLMGHKIPDELAEVADEVVE